MTENPDNQTTADEIDEKPAPAPIRGSFDIRSFGGPQFSFATMPATDTKED